MYKSLNFVAVLFSATVLAGCGGGNVGEDTYESPSFAKQFAGTSFTSPQWDDEMRISAGDGHTVVLGTDGKVYAWGRSDYGQLANSNVYFANIPSEVMGLSSVRAVRTGATHTVALKSDGTVWAWGNNSGGQLGSWLGSQGPVQVMGMSGVGALSSVKAIAAGQEQTVALKSDGTVWGWGRTAVTYGYSPIPTKVSGLSNIKAVTAGGGHAVALANDGTLWAWGENNFGQLGTGSTYSPYYPTMVRGLSGVKSVSAGQSHTIALKNDGSVWAWGSNIYGQTGDSSRKSITLTPTRVRNLNGVKSVAAGAYNSAVVHNSGVVSVWGNNYYGQLGNGTYTSSYAPITIPGITDAVAVSIGTGYITALRGDGAVFSAGLNFVGQLGNLSFTGSNVPVQAVGSNGNGYLNIGNSVSR